MEGREVEARLGGVTGDRPPNGAAGQIAPQQFADASIVVDDEEMRFVLVHPGNIQGSSAPVRVLSVKERAELARQLVALVRLADEMDAFVQASVMDDSV